MPDKQSIAFVSPRFAEGATVGGAETLLKLLAQRLQAAGSKVTFLTTCASDHFTWKNDMPPGERIIDGIKVIRFPVDADRNVGLFHEIQSRICRGATVSIEEEQLWLRHNVNSSMLCDHLRCNSDAYDKVILGPYLFGLVYHASAILPEKTILLPCLHDEEFAYLQSFKKMFHSANGIIFNSKPELDLAVKLYDIDISRTSVVGMGMTPFETDAKTFQEKHKITDPYLIYCGRREGLKGTPMLLDYVNAFRKRTGKVIKLVLTGSGTIDIPEDLSPHLIDLGFVCEKDKHDAMAGALAFCHPSAYESFGIVILEAWLAGTPCLVNSRSEVLKYHCANSNGGLWFRNYPDFEEELLALLKNNEFQSQLGENGKKYVLQNYCWEKVEQRLLRALENR